MNTLVESLKREIKMLTGFGGMGWSLDERIAGACAAMSVAANEIERLELENRKQAVFLDQAETRLDKLGAYMSDPHHRIIPPHINHPVWQWRFGHADLTGEHIDASGPTLREAIDKLP